VGESPFKGNQLLADSKVIDFTQTGRSSGPEPAFARRASEVHAWTEDHKSKNRRNRVAIGSVGGRIYPRGKIFPHSVSAGGASTLGRVIQFDGDSWLPVCILSARAGESRSFTALCVKIQPVCQKPDARVRPALQSLRKFTRQTAKDGLIHGTQIAAADR
jgi:hypothetical protein